MMLSFYEVPGALSLQVSWSTGNVTCQYDLDQHDMNFWVDKIFINPQIFCWSDLILTKILSSFFFLRFCWWAKKHRKKPGWYPHVYTVFRCQIPPPPNPRCCPKIPRKGTKVTVNRPANGNGVNRPEESPEVPSEAGKCHDRFEGMCHKWLTTTEWCKFLLGC